MELASAELLGDIKESGFLVHRLEPKKKGEEKGKGGGEGRKG